MNYRNYDPNSLWTFLVRPQTVNQPIPYFLLDAINQQSCTSVISADGYSAIQAEFFSPFWPFDLSHGDGGDVLVLTTDGYVKAVATQDGGGLGELYYFVGSTGWIVSGPDIQAGTWGAATAEIQLAYPGPYDLVGAVEPAYTRYTIATVPVPFSTGTQNLECIISEHYAGADPTAAGSMERSLYAAGYGKVLWEEWQVNGTPAPDLGARAVFSSPYTYPDPGFLRNAVMTDVRAFVNVVPVSLPYSSGIIAPPSYLLRDSGWPTGLILP